ncbi:MAG TPA: hemolysin III family protein [Thermoanaerobaculia bacterium]|nr:hemolysin III family protein [Thermoanaerobaculia bacterium]
MRPTTEAVPEREEMANAITHGVGIVASLVGGIVLIALAVLRGDGWQIASAAVFSVSLLLLYVTSTLYHAARGETAKSRLKTLDHCAIYVLIAGTYTPFTLVGLRGPLGWGLFTAIWGLALAGIIFKLFFTGRLKLLSTLMYVAMGWLVVVVIKPLILAIPREALVWLVVGGLSYTAGTLFYHNRRIPYSHAIWHLFVLFGSLCHFAAVLTQVASPDASAA